jgi:hypothetical protein
MKNFIRRKDSHTVRMAASALAVAAVIAGAAGIVAGRGNAAPPTKGHNAPSKNGRSGHAKLKHGLLKIKGTRASDAIALRLKAGDPGTLQVDFGDNGSADFSFSRNKIAKIAVDARAGNDRVRIDDGNGAFTDAIPTTIDGGDGNDTIAGGNGSELLLGGNGNDSIDGNGGNDLARLGAGYDTFVWDPGDGSDTIEGQDGTDRMLFNGANIAEKIELSANGNGSGSSVTSPTSRWTRTASSGSTSTPSAAPDVVTVNDLTGTDVNDVNVDLAGTLGGATGDGQADRVVVNATHSDDAIDASGDASEVKVSGLAPTVAIFHPEIRNDRLEINTLAGTDTVNSAGLAAGAIQLFVDGVLVP